MKRLLLLIVLWLTACGATVETKATPTNISPVEIAGTMMQFQLASQATQNAVNVQMTGTAQVLGATATSQAISTEVANTQQARLDVQATAEQARFDAAATQQRMDHDAATQQARKDAESTAEQGRIDAVNTQSANATATWVPMTLTAMPPHATLTAIAVNNDIVVAEQDVELSALELKKARDTNVLQWLIPTLIAITATGAGLLWVIRQSRGRSFEDGDGKIRGVIVDDQWITPNLLPAPVLNLRDGTALQLVAPSEQADVTKRAQAIDAIAAMPSQTTAPAAEAFNRYFSTPVPAANRFELLGDGAMPPAELLHPETLKAIEADWKESDEQ